jgi:hypothetical protein
MVNPLMLKLLYLKMFITAIFKFGLADLLHEKKIFICIVHLLIFIS